MRKLQQTILGLASTLLLAGCEGDDVFEFALGLGVFGVILAILLVILVIWAVVDIVQKPYSGTKKLL